MLVGLIQETQMKIITIIITIVFNYAYANAELKLYKAENPNTGVALYDYGDTWISLRFKNTKTDYIYTVDAYGQEAINHMIQLAKSGKGLATYANKLRKLQNDSNLIQTLPEVVYCGPYGGEEEKAYPIHTRRLARAALGYAHWAKNPKGIKECVCKHYPDFPGCKK